MNNATPPLLLLNRRRARVNGVDLHHGEVVSANCMMLVCEISMFLSHYACVGEFEVLCLCWYGLGCYLTCYVTCELPMVIVLLLVCVDYV
jgi:hypothetical protein